MRLRTFTVSLVAATAATLPLAGVAAAQPGNRNCDDFSTQQEAQAALLPGDPDNLDSDDDGQACENFDYESGTPTSPTDPVDEEPAEEEPADSGEDDATEDDSDDDGQVTVVPRGGVDTGDGSSGAEPAPFLIGGVLALGVAAAATRHRVRAVR